MIPTDKHIQINNTPGPCKDCNTRYLGCHGRDDMGNYLCATYGNFREVRDAENAMKAKRISETNDIYCTKNYSGKRKR